MRNTIRISKEEYDTLRELRFKQLIRIPIPALLESCEDENNKLRKALVDSKNQLAEKDETISAKKKTIDFLLEQDDKKNEEIEKLKEGIKWRDDGIKELEDEIDKKNEVIADLKNFLDDQKATIKRQNQQLTEHELFEKKMKEVNNNGGITNAEVVKRMCRLEAKYEAQENPYFF